MESVVCFGSAGGMNEGEKAIGGSWINDHGYGDWWWGGAGESEKFPKKTSDERRGVSFF